MANAIIPTSISRTALDSLHSKLSAIDGGWLNLNNDDDENHKSNDVSGRSAQHRIDMYCKLLNRIYEGIDIDRSSTNNNNENTMSNKSKGKRRRRQTPLVNGGYASRIAVMTFILERWMEHQLVTDNTTDDDDDIINVVILGCGMDILGVWSKYLVQDILLSLHNKEKEKKRTNNTNGDTSDIVPPKIKVYEFDAYDNCILKQRSMVNSGMLHESYTYNNSSDFSDSSRVISKGHIILDADSLRNDQCKQCNNEDCDDYFLTALDLRQQTHTSVSVGDCDDDKGRSKSILSHAMHTIGVNTNQPTIVLSELVLAYLGYNGANAIMESIAKDVLCSNGRSMFACLEPVFPSSSEPTESNHKSNDKQEEGSDGSVSSTKVLSVEESYAWDYSRQFLCKLQSGNSKYTRADTTIDNEMDSSSSWLHPLGTNSKCIKQRLSQIGFTSSNICYATLGRAASNVARIRRLSNNASNFLRANEAFDEHAALALNLNCYGVVCAFSSRGEFTITSCEKLDWRHAICPWWKLERGNHPSSTNEIRPIESSLEDDQVRILYGQIYTHLYNEYPAIRKMVKSALKLDLNTKVGPHQQRTDSSVIQSRFTESGGNFWIAKDIAKSRIIGCIGVRQRKKKGKSNSSASIVEYEIQRLAVDEISRGHGIGRKLLSIAEDFVLHQHECSKNNGKESSSPVTIKLWAVTPDCLAAANKLYQSVDYNKIETFQAGSLCMNVYCKSMYL